LSAIGLGSQKITAEPFSTDLTEENDAIDDALIQPSSGHSSRQSLEVYSRLNIGEAQEVYNKVMWKFPV